MTTWDEKAEEYAVTHHTFEHQHQVLDDLGYRWFVQGARWQREALLADEAVERAARAVYENRVAIIEDPEERRSWPAWEAHESSNADEWRAMARIALTAVMGDER